MQFLKILFWCLLAFLAAVFTVGNWNRIEIHLWNGIIALVNLPLLLLTTFLAGLLPTLAYHHAVRWRLKQRLSAAEQRAAFVTTPAPIDPLPVVPVAPTPVPTVGSLSVPAELASPATPLPLPPTSSDTTTLPQGDRA